MRQNATPRAIDTLNARRKVPIPWERGEVDLGSREIVKACFRNDKDDRYGRVEDRITYSYMTTLTASLSKLSPEMTVYNFGSTLYRLNMAKNSVTGSKTGSVKGSVADRVVPNVRHSTRSRGEFRGLEDQMYTRTP